MCVSIKIDGVNVSKISELESMNIKPVFYKNRSLDSVNWKCLCGLDLKATAQTNGYKFIEDTAQYVFEKEKTNMAKDTKDCPKIVIIDESSGESIAIVDNIKGLLDMGITPMFRDSIDASIVKEDECLCDVDIEKTAIENSYECCEANNIYTFVYDDVEYTEDVKTDLSSVSTSGIANYIDGDIEDEDIDDEDIEDEEDEDIEDEEDEEIRNDLLTESYSTSWMPIQWPDSDNWFVANDEGKTVCVFNSENVDTKEAAELVSECSEMLELLQTYYYGKADTMDRSIARRILKKFKMI